MIDRAVGLELAEFLANEKRITESRREFILRESPDLNISPITEQIEKLGRWEKMVREAAK